jgi:hypothetical protein
VAGLALPTRSVHRLPATRPRRERGARRPLGRARAARALATATSTLVLLAVGAAGASWALERQSLAHRVPESLAPTFRTAAMLLAAAAVVGLALSAVAAVGWALRWAWRRITPARDTTVIDLRGR